jgi:hypothetical protein
MKNSLLYILINRIHHIIVLQLYNILAIINEATRLKKNTLFQKSSETQNVECLVVSLGMRIKRRAAIV